MLTTLFIIGLFGQAPIKPDEPSDEAKQKIEALRAYYRKTAEDYEFYRDAAKEQRLELAEKPVMK